MTQETVTREAIVRTLGDALQPFARVLAFYVGGAGAWGRLDAWSDLDLYVVVDDDEVDEAFRKADEALARQELAATAKG